MPLKNSPSAWKGALAGAVGGLIGTAALDLYKQLLIAASRKAENAAQIDNTYSRQQERQLTSYHGAHATTAQFLATSVGGQLTPGQTKTATPLTHFAFGVLAGAVYGAAAEYLPQATSGQGTVFGMTLYAIANGAILPYLNLLPATAATPPVIHAEGFSSHAIYGAGTEAVRKLVRTSL